MTTDGSWEQGRVWWKEAVVYQVYPRSFMDSNGDGIGDLQGIISRLDYLQWLGIDVLWLSPVYESPNTDNGYDISDYRAIMAEFGNMEDFDCLLSGLHERNMKLMMDLVVNHTSDEHEWFRMARSKKDSPYRDYYIWRPNRDGKFPNNWASFFGGSVWKLEEQTNEYYLHLFASSQPDLNWENPQVRNEIYGMMRWWLDKGVDGFRMDVINAISKTPGLPDAPYTGGEEFQWGGSLFLSGPRVHEYLQEMNERVLAHYDLMTVGETLSVTPSEALQYVGVDRGELHMLFQFELMDIDAGAGGKWDVRGWRLSEFKSIMSRWQTELYGRGWNSLYLNNHDQPRVVSRFGNDKQFWAESAKMLATMLHTLQGTPFVYQGEEIGMTNVRFEKIEDYRDIETLNWYNEQVTRLGRDSGEALEAIHFKGRDNARTPLQWNDTQNAGFTAGVPWIQVNSNYQEINVEKQRSDPHSIVNYYRRLIELRRNFPVIVYGDYTELARDDETIYAFVRHLDGSSLFTILNFSAESYTIHFTAEDIPRIPRVSALLISNYERVDQALTSSMHLRPYEARVYMSSS